MSTMTAAHTKTRRPGYIAQVGLDFGTAYSKCVVRDVGAGGARVVEGGLDGEPYLFPSSVYYRNGEFSGGVQTGSLELPFAKVLLATLARNRPLDSRTMPWQAVLRPEPIKRAKAGAAWMLAALLREAQKLACLMMPGFGSQHDDLLYVNMCVPVDDMQDHHTREVFEDVLKSAWRLATQQQSDISSAEMAEMCFLYPEVAANVQAFLKSGFANHEWGNPFFLTDVGAGTADQSYFIPTLGLEALTFLSSLVESLGSSQIEKRCADMLVQNGRPEHSATMKAIRAFKEGRGSLRNEAQTVFARVVGELQHEMGKITSHTVSQGRSRLTQEGQQIHNQFGHTRVLFAGGGIRDLPYRDGVLNSFDQSWHLTPDSIELPRPNDLLRASGAQVPDEWFRRLTVAYGLSFMRQDLQKITLPNQLPNLPPAPALMQHGNGRCRACGRPTVFGDDYCYTHQ